MTILFIINLALSILTGSISNEQPTFATDPPAVSVSDDGI